MIRCYYCERDLYNVPGSDRVSYDLCCVDCLAKGIMNLPPKKRFHKARGWFSYPGKKQLKYFK